MGFLRKKTSFCKLFVCSLAAICLYGQNASATISTTGSFTDSNNITWSWAIDETYNEDPKVYIGFKSAPANTTAIVIPSMAEVLAKINDSSIANVTTYYVSDLTDYEAAETIPTGVTKLDMTNMTDANGHAGQIMSIAPLFENNTNEIELVFNNNAIISQRATTFNEEGYEGAFEGLKLKLTNFEKVKYIGWRAFRNATLNNTDVTISSSQTLGGHVFEGSNVKTLSLETEEIGEALCKNCSELTSVTFGDGVKTLYGSVFQNTPKLKQAFESKNIEEIGGAAFKNSAITSASFSSALKRIHAMAFIHTDLGTLDFTDISPKIDVAAFNDAGLNTIDLGSLTSLDTLAFGHNNLKEVYLPKSIEFIGAGIFSGNPIEEFTVAYDPLTLKQYSNPSDYNSNYFLSTFIGGTASGGINYDGEYVGFNDGNVTTNLTLRKLNIVAPYGDNDTIPARQKAMESYSLAAKYLGEVRNVIPYGYFQDTGTYLDEINIGEGIEYIAEQAFMANYITMGWGNSDGTEVNLNGMSPSKVTFPSTLRGIADRAFMWTLNNKNLVFESLPTNLVYIGGKAFAFNPNLNITNFDMPNLKYIGENAFIGANIKNIAIRDSIEYVGPRAFVGNWALESLTFDTDIFGKKNNTNIMGGRIGDIFTSQVARNFAVASPIVRNGGYQDSTDPLKYEMCINNITFTEKSITAPPADQGMYRLCAGTFDASAAKWTVINYHTFFGNRINEVKLPNTVTAINENAFMRAEITKPLTLPTGLKSIGTRAFWGAVVSDDGGLNETEIAKIKVPISNLPNTVETIGEYAFYKNSGFTADVTSPKLTRIGTQAFFGSNIRDLTLSNNITNIGPNVALNTPNLRNVTIDMNLHDSTKYNGSDGENYKIFVNNFGDGQHKLGKVTFTENAGQPFGGFGTYNDVYTPADALRTCYDPTECGKDFAYFYGLNAEEVDLSATNWTVIAPSMFQTAKIDTLSLPADTTLIGDDAFYQAELGETILPEALQTIDEEAFQWATVTINEFPESLRTINRSAFFGTDITDDLKIHGGIQYIGKDAFNAGDADVYYEKITLDPDLTYAKTANQPIFVVFYGAEVNKMTINSADLPALHADDGIPEFHGMTMQEVEITALPAISKNAFEDCSKLKKVDASKDTALRLINDEAFINDVVLDEIYFAPALKNETVVLGKRPFKKTAFTSIGGAGSDFNLSAAKFDGAAGYAFSGMPKVKSINVISTFSNGTVPEATFFNDTEVETAEIAFEISRIDNGAFANDNKLKSIFIWGDTEVRDNNLPGFTGNTGGSGGDNSDEPNMGPTIPEGTDIYAYSTWGAEPYAGSTARDSFEGEFYPLDEVLYIEANDPDILIDGDSNDFDKSEIVVYALRRDGVVLESTTWGQFSGRTFTRANAPVSFNDVDESTSFGVIHDTPVALNVLDYGNENFANIDGQLVADSSRPSGYRIDVNYRDAYTNYPSNDNIDPYTEGEGGGHPIPGLPVTRDELIVYLAVFTLSAIGLVAWSVNRLAKR